MSVSGQNISVPKWAIIVISGLHRGRIWGWGTGLNLPQNAHLKIFQHCFSISLQLQYCIVFSSKALCDTQKVLKRYLQPDPVGELTTLHQWLKWGGQGGSAPLLRFEPPAIVWAPLIESINCYLCPNNAKLVGCGMGMGFAPTWLRQVSPPPLLHMTTLTTALHQTP